MACHALHGCLEPRTTAGTVSGTEQRVRQRHVDSEGCPKIPWYHCVQLVVQLVTICALYCIAMIPYDSLTFERPQKQRCKALLVWPADLGAGFVTSTLLGQVRGRVFAPGLPT